MRSAPFIALALALAIVVGVTAQEPLSRSFGEQVEIGVVEITLEVRSDDGSVPDLEPGDLVVREDGKKQRIVSLERLGGATPESAGAEAPPPGQTAPALPLGHTPWQVVIYVDHVLSSPIGIREASEQLGDLADRLVALGPVEIVQADPSPRRSLAPTRSATELRSVLDRLAEEGRARDEINRIRRDFLNSIDAATSGASAPSVAGASRQGEHQIRILSRNGVRAETRIVGRQLDAMESWLATPSFAPRALVWVGEGYDADPAEFYLAAFPETPNLVADKARLIRELEEITDRERTEKLGQALASTGWTVLSYAAGGIGGFASDASTSGQSHFRSFMGKPTAEGLPVFTSLRNTDTLRSVGAATGGEVATSAEAFSSELASLGNRYRLSYQVNRPPDGEVHEIEITAKAKGIEIRAPRWVASGTPESVAASRARALLEESVGTGDLPSESTARIETGDRKTRRVVLESRVGFAPLVAVLPTLTAASMRVTLAIGGGEGPVVVEHQRFEGLDISQLGGWIYDTTVDTTSDQDRIAVVVEQLETGAWGGSVATVGR